MPPKPSPCHLNFSTQWMGVILSMALALSSMAQANSILPTNQNTNKNSTCQGLLQTQNEKLLADWRKSVETLSLIRHEIIDQDSVILAILTSAIAEEFIWLNGEPGGAKTLIARIMFNAMLNAIPEREQKIFLIQFHKLVSEGKITGFQKINAMLEDGRYEINTKSSLANRINKYFIGDEVEKSGPATLNALLGLMAERAAFHGSRVYKSLLASGVLTSNKSVSKFLADSEEDRPSFEAVLDRCGLKAHMTNQALDDASLVHFLNCVKTSDLVKNPENAPALPIHDFTALSQQIQIPDALLHDIIGVLWPLDVLLSGKAKDSRMDVFRKIRKYEYAPANQFSYRSWLRLIKMFKAAIVADALIKGRDLNQLNRTATRADLHLLAPLATFGGPSTVKTLSFPLNDLSFTVNGKTLKGVPVTSASRLNYVLPATWDPYKNTLTVTDAAQKKVQARFLFQRDPVTGELSLAEKQEKPQLKITAEHIPTILATILEKEKKLNINPNTPTYETTDHLNEYLDQAMIEDDTRAELTDIRDDQMAFVSLLNNLHTETQPARADSTPTAPQPTISARPTTSIKSSDKLNAEQAYNDSQKFIANINREFAELDYVSEGILTAVLSGEHAMLFGPPGGAKTMISNRILKAIIRSLQHEEAKEVLEKLLPQLRNNEAFLKAVLKQLHTEKPKTYANFILQFHKLLPEGVITGIPKYNKQFAEGEEELNVSTSLAAEKFIFAILDEADKANPQTLTALLSLLQERYVFAGSQILKAGLLTAVITSNKLPSELVESFLKDRENALALMGRVVNKIFVNNKPSSPNVLFHLLSHQEKKSQATTEKKRTEIESLPLFKLNELSEKVKVTTLTESLLAKIFLQFSKKRHNEYLLSYRKYQLNRNEFPDYYMLATTAANRNAFKLFFKHIQARFIIHQLVKGVPYSDLEFEIRPEHMGIFLQGFGYWTSNTVQAAYNEHHVLTFAPETTAATNILKSGNASRRTEYFLNQAIEEANDYAQVAKDVIQEYLISNRDFNAEVQADVERSQKNHNNKKDSE